MACSACGAVLSGTEPFEIFRVCPTCRRHVPLPARERLSLLVDADSFVEPNAALVSVDPLLFRDPLPVPDRLADARERSDVGGTGGLLGRAVVTGMATIGAREAVIVVLDHAYVGGGVGPPAGEKIVLAMDLARARRLPLVALCAAGGPRPETGMLSLIQMPRLAAAAAQLHRAGVPFVGVLAHPTTGGIYAGLANQADIILAEPGAQIGLGGGRAVGIGIGAGAETDTAETLLAHGLIDAIVDRTDLRGTLTTLLGRFADRGAVRPAGSDPASLPTTSPDPAWRAADLARHPARPTALVYVRLLVTDLVELCGDRFTADDPAFVGGPGRLGGVPIVVVAQDRRASGDGLGNRGPDPAGYRKAARLMRLGGHLEFTIVTLFDGPSVAGGGPEPVGTGLAIGQSFGLTSPLPVPIVSVVVGEGGGVGGLALGIADRMLIQGHALFVVVGPESPPVPTPGADPADSTAAGRRLTARDCLRLEVFDAVVPEPAPAAHADPAAAAKLLGEALSRALAELSGIGPRRLLDERTRRVRAFGLTTPDGREAAQREVREFQQSQRSRSRSFGDVRDRWEGRQRLCLHLPRPVGPLLRPALAELATQIAARRDAARNGSAPAPAAADEDR